MDTQAELATHFDKSRKHLRAVAFRMLGSADEAEDAVQDAWLRASHSGAEGVSNVTAWLTTIVARICLDMLRSRRRRGEEFTDIAELDSIIAHEDCDPAEEAVRADSVGLALLVVLNTLGPAERVAYVLHDLFSVPFDEIAEILQRNTAAAKKLASRARHRVLGTDAVPSGDLARQRQVVDAFLAASRAGDLTGLLAVLHPEVVRRADAPALASHGRTEIRGARDVARETLSNTVRAYLARPILVNGGVGVVVAPNGRLRLVLALTIEDDRITAVDVISDPTRLRELRLSLVEPVPVS
ncbi:RNA polymerase subunit sigma-70 [Spongiactinospora gelatinilytica]|uniref:RNA polymerase subunit sigma-70 n=1 Tax=Spongiactinospora gelatinilytica TaxID=2666298 RepID=A0A2W2GLC8_9ACTN|nr:sigma-70 family RNA polymerase sigma factor [Spongiactinospora gelatinilytica]PZG37938.1 RNA polymerase subunit sigma-70 [Spongiactinospora gelatinilytica]